MFFNSGLFWFFMGMITIIIGFCFKTFADERGWILTWWKWLLTLLWYIIFSLSILSYSTLTGEGEGSAGIKVMLLGFFVCFVYGAGLWRILSGRSEAINKKN